MSKELEISEYEDYIKRFDNMRQRFDLFLQDFLIDMAERVIDRTKKRTPVGTPESTGIPGYVGGSLRGAWQLGDITKKSDTLEVEILNGMEYATFIEYGHRITSGGITIGWREGRFMLTISTDEVRKQMPLRFEKAVKQFMSTYRVGE